MVCRSAVWECHPWPSLPPPDVFLRTTTHWGEPEVEFRTAGIAVDHLAELVTEAWRVQAPKYLRREFERLGL